MLEMKSLAWVGIGFTLAAAVGPIWLLVAQRTLARGWRFGLASGAGVALADGLYGLLGALGLQVVKFAFTEASVWMRPAGGVVMAGIGLRIFFSADKVRAAEGDTDRDVGKGNLVRAWISIFLLTLANPMTILSFAAVYTGAGEAGLGLTSNSAASFGAAIFSGSMLWWMTLVAGISAGKKRIQPRLLIWINRAAGAAITLLGLGMLFR